LSETIKEYLLGISEMERKLLILGFIPGIDDGVTVVLNVQLRTAITE